MADCDCPAASLYAQILDRGSYAWACVHDGSFAGDPFPGITRVYQGETICATHVNVVVAYITAMMALCDPSGACVQTSEQVQSGQQVCKSHYDKMLADMECIIEKCCGGKICSYIWLFECDGSIHDPSKWKLTGGPIPVCIKTPASLVPVYTLQSVSDYMCYYKVVTYTGAEAPTPHSCAVDTVTTDCKVPSEGSAPPGPPEVDDGCLCSDYICYQSCSQAYYVSSSAWGQEPRPLGPTEVSCTVVCGSRYTVYCDFQLGWHYSATAVVASGGTHSGENFEVASFGGIFLSEIACKDAVVCSQQLVPPEGGAVSKPFNGAWANNPPADIGFSAPGYYLYFMIDHYSDANDIHSFSQTTHSDNPATGWFNGRPQMHEYGYPRYYFIEYLGTECP